MQYKTIEFTGIKPGTECIDQPDCGITELDLKKEECQITWKIATDRIYMFRLKEISGDWPFTKKRPLPKEFVPELTMIAKKHSYKNTWVYSVEWVEHDGTQHKADPKISINPHGFDPDILIRAIICSFVGLFSLHLMFKRFRY